MTEQKFKAVVRVYPGSSDSFRTYDRISYANYNSLEEAKKNEELNQLDKVLCLIDKEDKEEVYNYIKSNKCRIDGYEKKLVKETKPEFKVDKLGWYKAENGNFYKVVHEMVNLFLCVDRENRMSYKITKEGNCADHYGIHLVEYIGPELPKEPRKFEFDAYLNESSSDSLDRECPLEKVLGHRCGFLQVNKILNENTDDKNCKWHVTMQEILED